MPARTRVRRAHPGVDDPVRLAGIRAGDIVRVHDGLPYLAEVIGHDGPRLRVAPITAGDWDGLHLIGTGHARPIASGNASTVDSWGHWKSRSAESSAATSLRA